MPDHITGERLTSLFRPRSVALVGASDKSTFSWIVYRNLVEFGFGEHTYLGVREAAPADRDALTAVIARIGDLAQALGDSLESLEVNPLVVNGARIEALDAIVTWREHS